MPLLTFERRQAKAILEAYAPPRSAPAGASSSESPLAHESARDAGGEAVSESAAPSGTRALPLLAPRVGEVDYIRSLLRLMKASTGMARLGIHLGLFISMWSPLWMCGRFKTMADLPIDERSEIIGKLLRHEVFFVRELMLLLKIGASMALLGTPSVRARSNYDRKRDPSRMSGATEHAADSGGRREGVRSLPVVSSNVSNVSDVSDVSDVSEVA